MTQNLNLLARLPFWRQIRWNLIIYSVFLATLPIVFVVGLTLPRRDAQDAEQISRQLNTIAQLKADQIKNWLNAAEEELQIFLADKAHYQQLLKLLTSPVSDQADQINQLLGVFKTSQSAHDEFFLYDLDGLVLASSDSNNQGKNVRRQPYFQSSVEQARYVQPPFYEIGSQKLALVITRSVTDDAGRIVGVFAGDLNLTTMGQIMTGQVGSFPTTGETYLVSLQTNYLLTPSRFEGYSLTQAYHSQGIDDVLKQQNGTGEYDSYRNVRVIGAYRWLPELQAGLVAEVETSEAFASSAQTRNVSLLIAGVATLVAGTFGLYYATSVSRPITRLTRAATAVAGGDYTQKTDVTTDNEIGQLTIAFNTMTLELNKSIQQLRKFTEELEERVALRTRDLEVAAQVSKQVTTIRETNLLLKQIADLTRNAFKLYHVSIFIYDSGSDRLNFREGAGEIGERMKAESRTFVVGKERGLVPQAGRTQQSTLANDVSSDWYHIPNPLLPKTASELALPMVVNERLIGVLDLQSEQKNRFGSDDIRVMTTLAEQVAIAVENVRLFEEAQSSREEAEKANQVKSQFLANMSHELRTPLNAILNFTAFVADGVMGPVNEEQREALQQTVSSGKHLLSLINDVLDITKIETGMMDLFIETVDVNAALAAAISTAKGLVKNKPIELIIDVEENLPQIKGDKRRIRQILLNLVSNAAKFTLKGSITISARHREGELLISVKDTGIGIARDDHALVFESFKQIKHDLPDIIGTGLGIPISKFFVEQHGGRIWLESEVDVGTTFFVVLPIQTEEFFKEKTEKTQA
jgi:signal transduction histidine kinase